MFLSATTVRIIIPRILRSTRIVHKDVMKCCLRTPRKHWRTLSTSVKLDLTDESTNELVSPSSHQSANSDLIQLIRTEMVTDTSNDDLEQHSSVKGSSADLRKLTVDQAKDIILQNFDPVTAVETLSQLKESGNNRAGPILHSVTEDLLNDGRFTEALNLAEIIAKEEVLRMKGMTYTRLLKGFVEQRKLTGDTNIEDNFAGFIHLMYGNGYETGVAQQHQVLRMASLVGNAELALLFFNQLKADEDYRIGRSDYGLLIQTLVKGARSKNNYGNHTTVLTYFNESVDSGLEIGGSDIKALIENSVLGRMVQETREVITKLTNEADLFLEYIDLLVRIEPLLGSGNVNRARKIYSKSRHFGYCEGFKDFYASTVTQFTDSIVADFNSDRALETISELYKVGDRRVTNIIIAVIEYLVKNNQLDDAVDFTKLLVQSDLPISSRPYTTLLRNMVEMKKVNMDSQIEVQFYSLIKFMSENGQKLTAYQQAHVLGMATLVGNDKLAQVCFDELKADKDYRLNSADYGRMLRVLINAARSKKDYSNQETVLRYFNDLVSKGLEIKPLTVKTLIENSILSKTVDAAREEVLKLPKDANYYLEYLDLLVDIEQLLRFRDVKGARQVWKKTKYVLDCERFMRLYLQ